MLHPEKNTVQFTLGEVVDITASDLIRNQQYISPESQKIADVLFVISHLHLIPAALMHNFDAGLAADQNVSSEWCREESLVSTMRAIDTERCQSFE